MKLQSIIVAASLMLASNITHAGVIYRWVEVENKMPVGPIYMQIEIAESVVRSGSFSLAVNPGETVIPNTGLVSFSYQMLGASPTLWMSTPISYLYIDLQFTNNNFFAVGSIRAQDWMARVHTSSGIPGAPLLWRINNTDWDMAAPCYSEPNGYCEGATGYFRQVPEPAHFALLSLGAFGALAARRRVTKHKAH
ncbi:PEP-CTERM sorting domain-containing protein [Massilia sp. 9I]|uniref:PEP-CTERM sorting domain-containing protein n=1 Tax=Massilia sp. 9I TaxID=2653152 RepID=UPI00135776FB|nr:PEP-CTERM sorting domain-containing protein [Massilia sp. 9I]